MNIIQELEAAEIERLSEGRELPDFSPGDTIRVNVRVVEGSRERIQAFEGVCIARRNAGVSSSFTVRKISYGEGVERVFPLYSPRIESVELMRRGKVRRAKLYYLRGLTGKRARIVERTSGRGMTGGRTTAKAAAAKPATGQESGAEAPAKKAAAKKPAAKKAAAKGGDKKKA